MENEILNGIEKAGIYLANEMGNTNPEVLKAVIGVAPTIISTAGDCVKTVAKDCFSANEQTKRNRFEREKSVIDTDNEMLLNPNLTPEERTEIFADRRYYMDKGYEQDSLDRKHDSDILNGVGVGIGVTGLFLLALGGVKFAKRYMK